VNRAIRIRVRLRLTSKPLLSYSLRLGMDITQRDVAMASGQSNGGQQRVGGIHVGEQRTPVPRRGFLPQAHPGTGQGQERGQV
jgi:hypothetical protein